MGSLYHLENTYFNDPQEYEFLRWVFRLEDNLHGI